MLRADSTTEEQQLGFAGDGNPNGGSPSNENRHEGFERVRDEARKRGHGHGHGEQCERVHRTLKRVVKARGALDAQEAAALREANKLMLWRTFGYASLVEYMEREMGYTPRSALERLRVAKAIEELPVLGEALHQGDLSFSAARELARVVTPETQQEWMEATAEKSVRQIEEMVAGHKPGDLPTDAPDPALKTKVLRYEVRLPVAALERRARKAFEKMCGDQAVANDRADDSDFIEACYLAVLDQCEAARSGRAAAATSQPDNEATGEPANEPTGEPVNQPTGELANEPTGEPANEPTGEPARQPIGELVNEPRYQVGHTRCVDCKRGWLHGATTVLLSPPELERALCDCIDIGLVDDPKPERAKRSIPKWLRRKVFNRDTGRCRVPGCRAIANVDCHHLEFVCNGGQHTLLNVLLLCEGHHLALHAGSLIIEGDAENAKFIFRPNSDFKLATRAVETAAALRKRGLAKEVVRAAVGATRTHVGTQDWTLEQWIELALRKVPPATLS